MAYPVFEGRGVLWAYLGPPADKPAFPEFKFSTVPADQAHMSMVHQECNYLQALEGGIDSSHVPFLHSGALNSDPLFKGARGNKYNMADLRPRFEVGASEGGIKIAVRRNAEPGSYYWRFTPVVLLHSSSFRRVATIRFTAMSGYPSTTKTA